MEVLDLFSAAAGGWSLGMHRAGFTTLAACEVEPWRRALYSENNPNAKVYDDVRTLTAERLRADLGRLPRVVVGSPPCQDISSANTKGKGVEGERSGLYFEAIRIIGEVRPRWFALENSANLRTRGADVVVAALEAIGYSCWPAVVRAGDIDANHERPRCWLLGCDLEQVANHDGLGRDEGWSWRRSWVDVPVPADTCDAASLRCASWTGDCEGGRPFIYRSVSGNDDGLRHAEYAESIGHEGGRSRRHRSHGDSAAHSCRSEVGLRAPNRGDAVGGGPVWSLADLADHLRVDDGLSARLAGTRVALGDGKGQSAASLIVEAFGDAVVPQIPEAIGHAILRTEAALAQVLGALPAPPAQAGTGGGN